MIEDKGNFNGYDRKLEFSDWRFSAAAVGIIRYLKYHKLNYSTEYNGRSDVLLYNFDDIDISKNEEKYYEFAEEYFKDKMHHKRLENLLNSEDFDEEKVKKLKKTWNSIMNDTFKDDEISIKNKDDILLKIFDNRIELIKKTFVEKKTEYSSMYSKFCNPSCMGKEKQKVCRIWGYYVAQGKKTKSLSFNWDYNTYVYEDYCEFDYIPFAFSKGDSSFFINNNFSTDMLLKSNDYLTDKNLDLDEKNSVGIFKNFKLNLFFTTKNVSRFLDYEVEIISKNMQIKNGKKENKEYFETMFLRNSTIRIFEKISNIKDDNIFKAINSPCKLRTDEYEPILDEVIDCILYTKYLDYLIDKLLRDGSKGKNKDSKENKIDNHSFLISQLIRINQKIYEGVDIMVNNKKEKEQLEKEEKQMNFNLFNARESAEKVVFKLKDTPRKIDAYRNKLISCLTFKDYEKFSVTLLQLSSYSSVTFDFAYYLFKDFEKNKNVAYTFVNALRVKEDNNKNGNNENK